ncbi:hypothetical protein PG987_011176 [Apiospora arundinis]
MDVTWSMVVGLRASIRSLMELLRDGLNHCNPIIEYIEYILLISLLIPIGTFLVTTYSFHIASRLGGRRFRGLEPPTLPYWIPFIGSGLSIATNPHKFYEDVMRKTPGGGIIKARVASLHMYVVTGPENVQTLFRNSKDLTFEFMQLRVAQLVKGLPASDANMLRADDSGTLAVPMSPVPADRRIWRQLHAIYGENLAHGSAVNSLTERFINEFRLQLGKESAGQWKTTQIYALLQDKMFTASTLTLVGPRILDSNVGFAKTFWKYDAGFMRLLLGTPRFACREAWDARDQCLEATKRWLGDGWANTDWSSIALEDPDWEPNFGHRLVRAREKCLESYGISLDGRASLQIGLIWAINANAIPMAAYMLIEMIHEPSLLRRIRDEVATVVGVHQGSSQNLDVAELCALPLLDSVYKECLRLRASIPLTRRLHKDIEIDGYTLRAGNFILAPSWLSHQDEDVWSVPGHPACEFWAERFMSSQKGAAFKAGNFFPYGGGNIICPGRFFAKQEILAAVAMVVASFDMEFVENVQLDGKPSERGPGVDNCDSRGIISLDRDVVVRMRRLQPEEEVMGVKLQDMK